MNNLKTIKYPAAISLKLTAMQRQTVEEIAETEQLSLGEAMRFLLDRGIKFVSNRPY